MKMEELLKKKKKDGMSETEKGAKTSVLSHLRDLASDAMGEKLHGLKKVTVAASDKKGLEEGLDKAKELVEKNPSDLSKAMEAGQELAEEGEEEASEMEECSPEEIDAKIAELLALKEKMKQQG